jgi:exo-beta-1,3-glucanase (GH17 family)
MIEEFSIFIRHYDSIQNRFDILYRPNDDRCIPVNKGVIIYDDQQMTEEQILSTIKMCAPHDEWQRQIEMHEKDHSVSEGLVNREIMASDIDTSQSDMNDVAKLVSPPIVETAPQVTNEVDAFIAEILNAQTNPQS